MISFFLRGSFALLVATVVSVAAKLGAVKSLTGVVKENNNIKDCAPVVNR